MKQRKKAGRKRKQVFIKVETEREHGKGRKASGVRVVLTAVMLRDNPEV